MQKFIAFFTLCSLLMACQPNSQNLNAEGEDILHSKQTFVDNPKINWRDTVYIPIYSDIYSESKNVRFNLTATLSIRNTSLSDSIFIEDINYYDSEGVLVREYLEKTLLLKPMQSIEYVIEENDTIGGTGANFIVNWGANRSDIQPMFQGVMISTHGQQGISFLTDGVSISRRK